MAHFGVAQAVQRYFESSSDGSLEARIVSFFGASGPGGSGGMAAPIPAYALKHRAAMWHLLEWSSDHAHAPVAVLTRPQYWGDLDLLRYPLPQCCSLHCSRCIRVDLT